MEYREYAIANDGYVLFRQSDESSFDFAQRVKEYNSNL